MMPDTTMTDTTMTDNKMPDNTMLGTLAHTIEDIYELSPAQHGILFHSLFASGENRPQLQNLESQNLNSQNLDSQNLETQEPESQVYFNQFCCTVQGNLDIPLLQQAWQSVVDRQTSLRTAFQWESLEKPVQIVYRQVQLPVEYQDWQPLEPAQQRRRLEAYRQRDRQRGFNLTRAPLMRLTIIRLDETTYHLIWSKHHLILDGWSSALVLQQVLATYEALCRQQPAPMVPIRPFGDYIEWLQQQDLRLAEQFWRSYLQGVSAPTALRVDRQLSHRPVAHHSTKSDRQSLQFSETLTASLQDFVRHHHLTLNTVVQGAWAVLLNRYSGDRDVVFGTTVSGRPASLVGAESIVGLLINTLPVRVQVSFDEPLVSWLRRFQSQQLEMREYEYTPLVQVQEWSEVPQGTPLFDSLVVFENYPIDPSLQQSPNLSIQAVQTVEETNYPLTLIISPHTALTLDVLYDRHRFDTNVIQRLLNHLQTLLREMVIDAEQPLSNLSLLTRSEREQIVAWNRTQVHYLDKCLHEWIEEQIERTPDSIALIVDAEISADIDIELNSNNNTYSSLHPTFTYRELNQRANQLAYYLRDIGVKPEDLVGVCLERSAEMVISLLAILKAGAAYVPIDPGYPSDRIAFMVSDARVKVILTRQTEFESQLQPLTEKTGQTGQTGQTTERVICLDTAWQTIARFPSTNPDNVTTPDQLAYVIYTSGSTGTPKGAMNTHRGVCNRLLWMREAYPLTPTDRVLQKTPFSFDVSVWEFFLPLMTGAPLVLAKPNGQRDSTYLVRLIQSHQITMLHFVPSMLQVFLDEPELSGCSSLKRIICSGEALPLSLQDRCLTRLNVELHNLYGPTEAAIDVTAWQCQSPSIHSLDSSSDLSLQGNSVPIGSPIANIQLYILDQQLQLVPIGVPGELYIGGIGVGRGYWNRPDLTAERFIPNPFAPLPGDRLYKTGDLARYQPDGTIEFLGRIDHQVKIRGNRIELGEIEAVLGQYPGVREAIVLVREGTTNPQLVAYIVPHVSTNSDSTNSDSTRSNPEVTAQNMQQYLKTKLPDYMLPTAWVMLDALPLTPNGKVDRRALPAPDARMVVATSIAPRTPVEGILAGIWSQILKVEPIGVEDNFFELGGHSLLATQVITRLRQAFGVGLPLRCLFEAPTIAQLSLEVEQALRAQKGLDSLAICPVPRRGQPFPLSLTQQRLWFLDQFEPSNSAYHFFITLRLQGHLTISALEQSLYALVQRHESLRTRFTTIDNQPVQIILDPVPISIPIRDLSVLPAHEQKTAIQQCIETESVRSFNLAEGRLWRLVLLRLADTEHIACFTLHHIITDGWSMSILVKDLTTLYAAHVQSCSVSLPNLPIQYADFAVWQRHWLQGEILNQQLVYWKQQLKDAPTLTSFPTDRPRVTQERFQGERRSLCLSKPLTQALQQLSHQEGVTLFMTLLAALKLLLYRHTGQTDLCIGSPIANRNRVETESVVGFFVNTLVLRTQLPEQADQISFRDLLAQVKDVTLNAYTHQDLPFEKLVEVLQPPRSLTHTPFFQIFFNLLNYKTATLQLPDLTIEELTSDAAHSKFDLTLYAQERSQGIHLEVVYNADLFDSNHVLEILEQFQVVLEHLVENPSQSIAHVPLLTSTAQPVLPNPTLPLQCEWVGAVHHYFAQQAHQFPNHLAIVDHTATWSYKQLHRLSNQLAHYLQEHGIQPNDIVAIHADRSAALVWATLGVLKAGAAFAILDSAYPAVRLGDRLRVIQPKGWIQLTQNSEHSAHVSTVLAAMDCPCQLEVIDSSFSGLALQLKGYSTDDIDIPVSPDDPAYIVFTSGSTGVPKAVVTEHRSLSHFLSWYVNKFEFQPADRFSLLSGLSHDPLMRDVFTPLWIGATIFIPYPEYICSAEWLLQWMKGSKISVTHLVPAFADLLTDSSSLLQLKGETQPHPLSSLRHVCLGGDRLYQACIDRLRILAPNATYINGYGTTETPQIMSYFVASDKQIPSDCSRSLPIGHGIADVQMLILNSAGSLAGMGEIGEIYIRTPYLARGYYQDPKLTEARFIANPFTQSIAANSNDRLYKTGDLGRYLFDGTVEFLGRTDEQVNLRGFRFELGEIAAVLRQHPQVKEAVVIMQHPDLVQHPDQERSRLVAYVVPQSELSQSSDLIETVRQFLAEQLPEVMIPAMLVSLEALPLTPNGKVDRRALPAPESVQLPSSSAQVMARTAVEDVITGIWVQLLNLESVGVHENFFALGGHSLLAMRIVGRIRQIFQVELPLRSLFEFPTIALLAEQIEGLMRSASHHRSITRPAIQPTYQPEALIPLSYAQQRLWFIDQLEPGTSVYNIPAAVRLTGSLNVLALEQSIQEIVQRHAVLRTRFVAVEGEPYQVVESSLRVSLKRINLRTLDIAAQEEQIQQFATEAARHSFNLETDPLLYVVLLQLSELEHVILFVIHHIVADGWSMGVLMQELTALYTQFSQGQPSPLPDLSIQYADYAIWQRQCLQREGLEVQLAYWKNKLHNLSTLNLPTDYPRPAVQTFQGAIAPFSLSKATSDALSTFSQQQEATLFMTLLAAFQAVLHGYTQQDDIVMGTDVANRYPVETESLIGFFVNQLVLRTDVSGNPSFTTLLQRVRLVTLEAYAHQDLPFDQLVDALTPKRDLSRTPLFQVKLVLQNAPTATLELPDLTLQLLPIDRGTTKFDLLFNLAQTDDGISGSLHYSTDLFKPRTIDRLLKRFKTVLETVLVQPEIKLDELSTLLDQQERQDQQNDQQQRKQMQRQKLKTIKRKAVYPNDS